jgi:hypothetical protein
MEFVPGAMESITLLPPDLPEALRQRRKDERIAITLPLRLTSGSGDMIPAVLLNLSPSGLLALVDTRSSPLLPPPPGSRVTGEFFLDELEIRGAELEVVRVEQRDERQVALGCILTARPEMKTALRAKVAAYLTASPAKGKAE